MEACALFAASPDASAVFAVLESAIFCGLSFRAERGICSWLSFAEETAGPSSGHTSALARDDNVVAELGAASKSNSSCCVLPGGFFRGEVMPRISSSLARGGGAAGAAVRDGDGADVAGDGAAGASVADGMMCPLSSTGV